MNWPRVTTGAPQVDQPTLQVLSHFFMLVGPPGCPCGACSACWLLGEAWCLLGLATWVSVRAWCWLLGCPRGAWCWLLGLATWVPVAGPGAGYLATGVTWVGCLVPMRGLVLATWVGGCPCRAWCWLLGLATWVLAGPGAGYLGWLLGPVRGLVAWCCLVGLATWVRRSGLTARFCWT